MIYIYIYDVMYIYTCIIHNSKQHHHKHHGHTSKIASAHTRKERFGDQALGAVARSLSRAHVAGAIAGCKRGFRSDQIQGILRWSEMIREALDDSHMLSNWLVSQMWRIRCEPSYFKPSIQQFSTDLLEVAGRCGTRPAARSSLDWHEERPLEHDLRDLEEDHLAIINIPHWSWCFPFVCKILEQAGGFLFAMPYCPRVTNLCYWVYSTVLGQVEVPCEKGSASQSTRHCGWPQQQRWKMCNGYVRSVNKPRNWKNSLYWWNRRS